MYEQSPLPIDELDDLFDGDTKPFWLTDARLERRSVALSRGYRLAEVTVVVTAQSPEAVAMVSSKGIPSLEVVQRAIRRYCGPAGLPLPPPVGREDWEPLVPFDRWFCASLRGPTFKTSWEERAEAAHFRMWASNWKPVPGLGSPLVMEWLIRELGLTPVDARTFFAGHLETKQSFVTLLQRKPDDLRQQLTAKGMKKAQLDTFLERCDDALEDLSEEVEFFYIDDDTKLRVEIEKKTTPQLAQALVSWPAHQTDPSALLNVSARLYADLLAFWGEDPHRPPSLQRSNVVKFFDDISRHGIHIGDLSALRNDAFLPHTISDEEGIQKAKGLLLYGPPGTNKSSIARHFSHGNGVTWLGLRSVFEGSSVELHRPLVGQTEALLWQLAERTRLTPHLLSVIFIDEIDTIGQKRSFASSEHMRSWLSLLLRIMDSPEFSNLYMIGTTNRRWMLDPAFVRPGRLEVHGFFPRMLAHQRMQFLSDELSKGSTKFAMVRDRDKEAELARLTLNWSGSMLKQAVRRFKVRALATASSLPVPAVAWELILEQLELTQQTATDPEVSRLFMEKSAVSEERVRVIQSAVDPLSSHLTFDWAGQFTGLLLMDAQNNIVEARLRTGVKTAVIPLPEAPVVASDVARILATQVFNVSLLLWVNSERLEIGMGDDGARPSIGGLISQLMEEARATSVEPGTSALICFDMDDLVGPSEEVSRTVSVNSPSSSVTKTTVPKTETVTTHAVSTSSTTGGNAGSSTTSTPASSSTTTTPESITVAITTPLDKESRETSQQTTTAFTMLRRDVFQLIVAVLRSDPAWLFRRRLVVMAVTRNATLLQMLKQALNWGVPVSRIPVLVAPGMNPGLSVSTQRSRVSCVVNQWTTCLLVPQVHRGSYFYVEISILVPGELRFGVVRVPAPASQQPLSVLGGQDSWAFSCTDRSRFGKGKSSPLASAAEFTIRPGTKVGLLLDMNAAGSLCLFVDGVFIGVLFSGLVQSGPLSFGVSVKQPCAFEIVTSPAVPKDLPPIVYQPFEWMWEVDHCGGEVSADGTVVSCQSASGVSSQFAATCIRSHEYLEIAFHLDHSSRAIIEFKDASHKVMHRFDHNLLSNSNSLKRLGFLFARVFDQSIVVSFELQENLPPVQSHVFVLTALLVSIDCTFDGSGRVGLTGTMAPESLLKTVDFIPALPAQGDVRFYVTLADESRDARNLQHTQHTSYSLSKGRSRSEEWLLRSNHAGGVRLLGEAGGVGDDWLLVYQGAGCFAFLSATDGKFLAVEAGNVVRGPLPEPWIIRRAFNFRNLGGDELTANGSLVRDCGSLGFREGVHQWCVAFSKRGQTGITLKNTFGDDAQNDVSLSIYLTANGEIFNRVMTARIPCFAPLKDGDVVAVRLDCDGGNLFFGLNGRWNTQPSVTNLEAGRTWYPYVAFKSGKVVFMDAFF